jgi:nucleoid DNA-binding protein
VKEKAKRCCKDPVTGKDLIIAPRKVGTFKWLGKLKEKLNTKPKTKAKKDALKA